MNTEEETDAEELKEAIAEQLQALPKPVQDFVTGPERSRVALSLSQKHNLHVDQADIFDVALIHMLLGVSTPEEFTKSLSDAGIPPVTVAALATDVNNEVFVRLRDEERKGSLPETVSASQPRSVPLPPPTIEYQAPPVPTTLPGSPVPAPMAPAISTNLPALAQPAALPMVSSEVPALEPTPASVPAQHIAHSMPAATHQPGWHPAAAVHIFVPTQGPSAYQHQQAPVPAQEQHVYVPAPAPQQITPQLIAPERAEFVPQAPPPIQAPEPSTIPIKKDYAADPYREPIQ